AEPPVAVVETVLHELWHATLFVPGAAAFNESSATFAGHRGAIAFFCAGPGADRGRCSEARQRWAAVRARGRVLEHLAARLRRLYATPRRPRSASACGSAWRGPRRRRSRAGAPADATISSRRTTR